MGSFALLFQIFSTPKNPSELRERKQERESDASRLGTPPLCFPFLSVPEKKTHPHLQRIHPIHQDLFFTLCLTFELFLGLRLSTVLVVASATTSPTTSFSPAPSPASTTFFPSLSTLVVTSITCFHQAFEYSTTTLVPNSPPSTTVQIVRASKAVHPRPTLFCINPTAL